MTQPERIRSLNEMSAQQLRELITAIVTREQGCKGVELVTKVVVQAHNSGLNDCSDGRSVLEMLQRMVDQDELVEFEYVLPEIPYRTKSFFLPKDTKGGLAGPGKRDWTDWTGE